MVTEEQWTDSNERRMDSACGRQRHELGALLPTTGTGLRKPGLRLTTLRSQGELSVPGCSPPARRPSLVLPAFVEEENIGEVASEALAVLPRFTDTFEIIVVDDGSRDRTAEIAADLARQDHASVSSGISATGAMAQRWYRASKPPRATSSCSWMRTASSISATYGC